MRNKYIYFPVFRIRQQEILVLKKFNFGHKIIPILEFIKEKDRTSNKLSSKKIYSDLINSIKSDYVLLDLPIYFQPTFSTSEEVIKFFRKYVDNMDNRCNFIMQFESLKSKVVPVISSYLTKTGEMNTINEQFNKLSPVYNKLAFRFYTNKFNETFEEAKSIIRKNDLLIYDMDSIPVTSPIVKKNTKELKASFENNLKIVIRSAINEDIQNNKLENGEVIGEADNSIIEYYFKNYNYDAWGDYVGIKKDEISAGGSISPGFIFYDPVENYYYGYKGNIKSLSEFENTIVPEVLKSNIINQIRENDPEYLKNNEGYNTLLRINNGAEKGKNQAKFKKISMEHYLHCIKLKLDKKRIPYE